MQKTPIPPVSPGPGYERIRDALETILVSEKFLSAPQMSAFLRYVVVQAATGNKNRIKAYTVAVDALGKPETFDPQNDPVVRVLAGRLRSTLSAYYEQHPDADVIIKMKPGSYVPSFILREAGNQQSDEVDTADSKNDAGTSVEKAPADSTVLSVDLAHAANNQWTLNTAGEPLAAARTLDVSYQQATPDSTGTTAQRTFNGTIETCLLTLTTNLRRFPKLTAAAALFSALLVGMSLDGLLRSPEPVLMASNLSQNPAKESGTLRPRPDSVSLFISDMAAGNPLANQVNTTMSSVFSESGNIRVYRRLQSAQVQQFWPEDYHLSLNVLPLTGETQISVQLIDAQTGHIIHSEVLHLSADAPEGLSDEDLQVITDCARRLSGENGPLSTDYATKTAATKGS